MSKTLACLLFLPLFLQNVVANVSYRQYPRVVPFSNATTSSTSISSFSSSTQSPSSSASATSKSVFIDLTDDIIGTGPINNSIPTNDTTPSNETLTFDDSSLPCDACVLQANYRKTLTYDFEVEKVTGTVKLVPYVTIFPNTTVTSWSTITQAPNSTTRLNATGPATAFDGLSTELTWEFEGFALTYPTTYVVYGDIVGGVPVPTTTQANSKSDCKAPPLDSLPTDTHPPASIQVYPLETPQSTDDSYVLPPKLIDFFAAQPNVSSEFAGHDLHTCTQIPPTNAALIISNPGEVQKTSVLMLTTQTASAVVKTVDTTLPTKADTVKETGNAVPATDPQGTQAQAASSDNSGGSGTANAILGALGITTSSADNQAAAAEQGSGSGSGAADTAVNAVDVLTGTGNQGGGTTPSTNGQSGSGGAANSNGQASTESSATNQNSGGSEGQSGTTGGGVANAVAAAIGGTPAAVATPNAPAAQPVVAPALTLGTNTITANAAGDFAIGTSTLRAGGPAVTTDGTTLSLAVNAAGSTVAVVNGVSVTLASPTQPAVLTIGSQTITANAAGSFVVGSSTLSVGGSALTTDGTTISLATNGAGATVAVINGKTSTLSPPATTSVSPITFEGKTISATTSGSSTFFVVDGTTLKPGQVATIHGSIITAPTVAATATKTGSSKATTLQTVPTATAGALAQDSGANSMFGRSETLSVALVISCIVLAMF